MDASLGIGYGAVRTDNGWCIQGGLECLLKDKAHNPRQNGNGVDGPFVTLAYWSPSVESLQRVIGDDPTIHIPEPLQLPPTELALGTTGLYLEINKESRSGDMKTYERAEYTNKGKFLSRVLSLGRFTYYFSSREDKDE